MNILLAFVWSPYTTASYYAKAFRALGHDVRTIGPCDTARWAIWPEGRRYRLTGPHFGGEWGEWRSDVVIWIEAGGDWVPSLGVDGGVPHVAYFIDSHSRLRRHKDVAPYFTHRFCAHRQYAEALGATWLPVACDPDVHTPTVTGEPEYDVAFVGNTYDVAPMYRCRRRALSHLSRRYRVHTVKDVYFEDMANVYAGARVAFNRSAYGDLNMRVFEAMCSGRPVAADNVEGLGALFTDGEHLSVYESIGYTVAIDELLKDPEAAATIGQAGRAEVIAHHTYAHRAAQMLAAL